MKVKLDINFVFSIKSIKGNGKAVELYNSFFNYLSNNLFNYRNRLNVGEFINIEDIIKEWADKEGKKHHLLYRYIQKKVKVIEITHQRDYCRIYCTDMYSRE